MIYDATHKTAAVHKAGSPFFIADVTDLNEALIQNVSAEELEYRRLWCAFFESIAIKARQNPKLQSQNIPKRFWQDTVELC